MMCGHELGKEPWASKVTSVFTWPQINSEVSMGRSVPSGTAIKNSCPWSRSPLLPLTRPVTRESEAVRESLQRKYVQYLPLRFEGYVMTELGKRLAEPDVDQAVVIIGFWLNLSIRFWTWICPSGSTTRLLLPPSALRRRHQCLRYNLSSLRRNMFPLTLPTLPCPAAALGNHGSGQSNGMENHLLDKVANPAVPQFFNL